MTYPLQLGVPQIILLLIATVGFILLLSMFAGLGSRRKYRAPSGELDGDKWRRRPYRRRWGPRLGRGVGGLVLMAIAISLLWLTFLVQSYLGLTGDIRVAQIHATHVANEQHMMSVELVLYDKNGHQVSDNTYIVRGDEWELQGDIVKFPSWMNALGIHSGYKLTRLEGRYDSISQEQHAEHTVIALNGGDDNFFQTARQQTWLSPFVDAQYGNGVIQTTGTYNVYVSQTGLYAKVS